MNMKHILSEDLHFLTGREFMICIIAILITLFWGLLTGGMRWGADIGEYVNTLNVIASMFALGLPIFLLTGLMFSSPTSRAYLQRLTKQGVSNRRLLLFRFSQCLALVNVFVLISTILVFVEPYFLYLSLNHTISLGYFAYLPSALIASFIVGSLLTFLATLLSLAADNVYLSAILGSSTTLIVSSIAGWDASMLNSSVTPNLALISPHNLVRMLAAILSNYDFTVYDREVMYFGIRLSPASTTIALIGFSILGAGAIIISIFLMNVNLNRWQILSDMVASSSIWERDDTSRDSREITGTRKRVRLQRTAVVFILCTLLLSLGLGRTALVQNIVNTSTFTYYQSPEGGEPLTLGSWTVFEFTISNPYPDVPMYLRYGVSVLDWGNCPDELSYTHAFLNMSQSDFLLLNETSKLDLCRTPRNRTRGDWGGFGGSVDIEEQIGIHIVVLYVYATTNSSITGFLHVSIEISQRVG